MFVVTYKQRNAFATAIDKVGRCLVHCLFVVKVHVVEIVVVAQSQVTVCQHHRSPRSTHRRDVVVVEVQRNKHQSVAIFLVEHVYAFKFLLRIAAAVKQHHAVTAFGKLFRKSADKVEVERVVEVGQAHQYSVCFVFPQAPRRVIGAVAALLCNAQNFFLFVFAAIALA